MRTDRTIIFEHAGDRMQIIIDSFAKVAGRPLLSPNEANPEELWNAPFGILAHAMAADPVFFYGNRTALELFETDAATLLRTPSRCSAKPVNRADRDRMFECVRQAGFIHDYSGDRITATGREFRIDQATVWNVVGPKRECIGQAACFDRWRWL